MWSDELWVLQSVFLVQWVGLQNPALSEGLTVLKADEKPQILSQHQVLPAVIFKLINGQYDLYTDLRHTVCVQE